MSKYSWTISASINGPRGSTMTYKEVRAIGKAFRMLDGDRNVCLTGFIAGEYEGFEPLDDFGAPSEGCTTIQYQNINGQWEDL